MVTVETSRGTFKLSDFQVKSIIFQLEYSPKASIFLFIPKDPKSEINKWTGIQKWRLSI